jgi:hypothetical protein
MDYSDPPLQGLSNVPRKKRQVFFYKYASFNEGPKSFDMFRICKGK